MGMHHNATRRQVSIPTGKQQIKFEFALCLPRVQFHRRTHSKYKSLSSFAFSCTRRSHPQNSPINCLTAFGELRETSFYQEAYLWERLRARVSRYKTKPKAKRLISSRPFRTKAPQLLYSRTKGFSNMREKRIVEKNQMKEYLLKYLLNEIENQTLVCIV